MKKFEQNYQIEIPVQIRLVRDYKIQVQSNPSKNYKSAGFIFKSSKPMFNSGGHLCRPHATSEIQETVSLQKNASDNTKGLGEGNLAKKINTKTLCRWRHSYHRIRDGRTKVHYGCSNPLNFERGGNGGTGVLT